MADKNFIILPLNIELNRTSDYYRQMAQVLKRKGYVIFAYHDYRTPLRIKNTLFTGYRVPLISSKDKRFISFTPIHPLPFDRVQLINQINQVFSYLLFLLYIRLFRHGKARIILWIVSPVFYWMVPLSRVVLGNRLVSLYDCLDYMTSEDARIERKFRDGDRYLLRHADVVTTNNDVLQALHRALRPDVQKVPAGFRLHDFQSVNIKRLPHKRYTVGYAGTINYRLDYPLLESICLSNPAITFQFIGPLYQNEEQQEVATGAFRHLCRLPNVEWRNYVKPKELYKLMMSWDVGIIPYRLDDLLNRHCEPLKLMEYFYAGIPVIATPIPSLKKYDSLVHTADDAAAWNMVLNKLTRDPAIDRHQKETMRRIAVENSWEAKVETILTVIDGMDGKRPQPR